MTVLPPQGLKALRYTSNALRYTPRCTSTPSLHHHELFEVHDRAHDRRHRREIDALDISAGAGLPHREELDRIVRTGGKDRLLFLEQPRQDPGFGRVGQPAGQRTEREAGSRRLVRWRLLDQGFRQMARGFDE